MQVAACMGSYVVRKFSATILLPFWEDRRSQWPEPHHFRMLPPPFLEAGLRDLTLQIRNPASGEEKVI